MKLDYHSLIQLKSHPNFPIRNILLIDDITFSYLLKECFPNITS